MSGGSNKPSSRVPREQADERGVECAFRQVSLLNCIDVCLFDGLAKS